jgi:hypothetical protein
MDTRSAEDIEDLRRFKIGLAHRLSNITQALEIRLGVLAPEIVTGNPTLKAAAETVEEINGLVRDLRGNQPPSG